MIGGASSDEEGPSKRKSLTDKIRQKAEEQLFPPSTPKDIKPNTITLKVTNNSPTPPKDHISFVGGNSYYKSRVPTNEMKTILPASPQSLSKNIDLSMYKKPSAIDRIAWKNSANIKHDFAEGGIAPLSSASANNTPKNTMIPIILTWNQGGAAVHVTGTFNNWKKKIRMSKSNTDFTTIIDFSPGKHQIKFIIDDEWKCSDGLPITKDNDGNFVNSIQVFDEKGDGTNDGFDNCESGSFPISQIDSDDDSNYTSIIPAYLLDPSPPKKSYHISEEVDLTTTTMGRLKLDGPLGPPPDLPRLCTRILLNGDSSSTLKPQNGVDSSILPVPSHVLLNHLYACSIRDGVMTLGCTSRYRKKFVTTVLYKPVFNE